MRKRRMILLLAALMALLLATVSSYAEEQKYTDLDQLSEATIGAWAGSAPEYLAEERWPDATLRHYNGIPEMVQDTMAGRVDGFVLPVSIYNYCKDDFPDITEIKESVGVQKSSVVFHEEGELQQNFNKYVAEIRASGRLEKLESKWMDSEDEVKFTPPTLKGDKGTLRIATNPVEPPLTYMEGKQYTGLETELVYDFCKEYGYGLELVTAPFDSMLAGVKTGKYDAGYGNVEMTEERVKSIVFGDPLLETDVVACVIGENKTEGNIIEIVKAGINRTFFKEDRWKIIVAGMETTLLITLFSILGGSILGYLLYLWCYRGGRIRNKVMNGISAVFLGLPAVVMLMIVYYVVFGNSRIPGWLISVLAFGALFAVTVFGLLKSCVETVGKDQREGALALGYTESRAFHHIILPQAMTTFLPLYKVEVVNLMKATAIVGYVAVEDLTRAGDLIRAATFDAFFPLIAVALVYLLLTAVLIWILNRVIRKWNPKLRSKNEILRKR